jgi:hypothetical protein
MYEARPRASKKERDAPREAWAVAQRMSVFVRTEVGRARHVAIVKGLKRKLCLSVNVVMFIFQELIPGNDGGCVVV